MSRLHARYIPYVYDNDSAESKHPYFSYDDTTFHHNQSRVGNQVKMQYNPLTILPLSPGIAMELINKSYFNQLAAADPDKICRHGRCHYLAKEKGYILNLWGQDFRIYPAEYRLEQGQETKEQLHEYSELLAIYYLLQTNNISLTGEWISEKDLPGGPTFFRGPHLLPTARITDLYGNNLQPFHRRCQELGGTRIDMADAAYSFTLAPDLAIAVLYWLGDDEFPAEAKVLYDRSIGQMLTLDIVFALAYTVCYRFDR